MVLLDSVEKLLRTFDLLSRRVLLEDLDNPCFQLFALRVIVVLYCVVASPRDMPRYLRPLVAEPMVQLKDHLMLSFRDL